MASKSDVRSLEYTLVAASLFSSLAVYDSDPSGFGPLFLGAVAYFACLLLIIAGLGLPKGRRLTYFVMTIILAASVILAVYVATAGNGSPVQGDQTTTSCTNIQITNSTSPTGFTGGTSCTSSPYYSDSSIWYNVVFWTPLVGALIYAMPSWIEPGKRNAVTSLSRILKGSVPVGVLLLLTFGLDNASLGYPELFNGHSPLNPFVAYRFCDSVTFGSGCVQVDAIRYFADLAFWIATVAPSL